jgi:hypothetical protein
MTLYLKAPQARVDYRIDWGARHLGPWLITDSAWRVEPVPQNPGENGSLNHLAIAAQAHDGRVSSVTVTGGEAGHIYDLINRITLSNGEVDERAVSFRVEAR